MTEAPRNPGSAPPGDDESPVGETAVDEETPRGTLFTLMVYMMVLAGMWGVLYWMMLER